MSWSRKVVGIILVATCLVCTTAFARAKDAVPLVQQMVGTWDVTQRMWPGQDKPPITLPAATAQRRLVGNLLLQEVMNAVPDSKQRFTRIAYLGYNDVTRQYEYFSWDTRAPQMMTEKSRAAVPVENRSGQNAITLNGGTFVAAQWGRMKNAAFRYRLVLGQIQRDRQLVRLYLTPQFGSSAKEFLAFEYVYTKRQSGTHPRL